MVCPAVLLGVATVAWSLVADTLPLPLFFDGCVVVAVAAMDALQPMSLRSPSLVDALLLSAGWSSHGYFAASSCLVDALPLCAFVADTLPLLWCVSSSTDTWPSFSSCGYILCLRCTIEHQCIYNFVLFPVRPIAFFWPKLTVVKGQLAMREH